MTNAAWDRMRTVGRRQGAVPERGFGRLRRLLATLERLREFEVVRPRGVFRFRSFEEANEWWLQTAMPRRRTRRTSRT